MSLPKIKSDEELVEIINDLYPHLEKMTTNKKTATRSINDEKKRN